MSGFIEALAPKPFQAPTVAYQLLSAPLQFLLRPVHRLFVHLRGPVLPRHEEPLVLVAVSDTHTRTPELPAGDVLIHACDMGKLGSFSEVQAQIDWLDSQPHAHVVLVAGNHDAFLDPRSRKAVCAEDKHRPLDFKRVHYLQHSSVVLEFARATGTRKLVVYGAPGIPAIGGSEMSFQYPPAEDAWANAVPAALDVLVTHTPPRWHLDLPQGIGCPSLLKELWRKRPKVHVFGHVHAGQGTESVHWDEAQRAWERLCARRGMAGVLNAFAWLDVCTMLLHDVLGMLWARIWGGRMEATFMVNAAHVDFEGRPKTYGVVVEI